MLPWALCRRALRSCMCRLAPDLVAFFASGDAARMHLSPDRAGRQPTLHEKTMHLPASQPTPTEPRILVQSRPSPVEAHPPHDSSASRVLTHSSAEWDVVSIYGLGACTEPPNSQPPEPAMMPVTSPFSLKWCSTAASYVLVEGEPRVSVIPSRDLRAR